MSAVRKGPRIILIPLLRAIEFWCLSFLILDNWKMFAILATFSTLHNIVITFSVKSTFLRYTVWKITIKHDHTQKIREINSLVTSSVKTLTWWKKFWFFQKKKKNLIACYNTFPLCAIEDAKGLISRNFLSVTAFYTTFPQCAYIFWSLMSRNVKKMHFVVIWKLLSLIFSEKFIKLTFLLKIYAANWFQEKVLKWNYHTVCCSYSKN